MTTETINQMVDGGIRAAPPITVSAVSFMGLGLESWMYIATITYTVLQGSYLVYKWKRGHRRYKEQKNGTEDN